MVQADSSTGEVEQPMEGQEQDVKVLFTRPGGRQEESFSILTTDTQAELNAKIKERFPDAEVDQYIFAIFYTKGSKKEQEILAPDHPIITRVFLDGRTECSLVAFGQGVPLLFHEQDTEAELQGDRLLYKFRTAPAKPLSEHFEADFKRLGISKVKGLGARRVFKLAAEKAVSGLLTLFDPVRGYAPIEISKCKRHKLDLSIFRDRELVEIVEP
jgi:hypothetical protein